ncbi:hypothetical protein EV44_g3869 [Erysiphe necator]|uniref:Uncharacterized protein n=1 Tax=Uncinula necator TaxID=52586 RepID=A0A0B1PBF8_UNCNE|nr:hypothetical protein EV44_g3869 [Erysiphe necator]
MEQVILIDAECFPSDFHRISFITSRLSGKAWDAVQDGVKRMNSNPLNPNSWFWKTPASLWQILDNRYILLDSTQSAKNALDTLFQDKRPYGDFKADFDHFAAKAMYDDWTKVDMLRKRLNKKITSVIDNQINLPGADDFASWSEMTNSIARNLQQQEHIAKLNQHPNTSRNIETPVQQGLEVGDPMDLSRLKLSDVEKKFRTDNNLCVAF